MIATSDFRPLEPIAGEPDIDESYIRQCDPVVLQTLLIDRTETHLNKATPVNCLGMDWEIGKPVLFMPPFDFKPIEEQEKK